jgi:uncharacterized Fe-S radical SAM superfamily protein PflX
MRIVKKCELGRIKCEFNDNLCEFMRISANFLEHRFTQIKRISFAELPLVGFHKLFFNKSVIICVICG